MINFFFFFQLITIFLLAITAADLGLGIYWKNNSTIHPVDYVTPIIKILTFVYIHIAYIYILCNCTNLYCHLLYDYNL